LRVDGLAQEKTLSLMVSTYLETQGLIIPIGLRIFSCNILHGFKDFDVLMLSNSLKR